MSMRADKSLNDEINLSEMFITLWRGKYFIIFLSVFTVFIASYYLQNAERKYTVEYNLKPVGDSKNKLPMSGLGGFASFAGIQLPSNSNSDFIIFKELITSVEASEKIFDNKEIIKNIFKSEWNMSLNNFSKPSRSKAQRFFYDVKNLLTGNDNIEYIPPNAERLAAYVTNIIQITEDNDTGFLKITSKTSNPDLIVSLIVELSRVSDKIMRQRYIEFSAEPLAFYKEKMRTARSREHRETLASLIGTEEQKLMLASVGKFFIAEPYLNPTISLYPTAPKPKLVLAISLVLGLLIGSGIILIKSVIARDN